MGGGKWDVKEGLRRGSGWVSRGRGMGEAEKEAGGWVEILVLEGIWKEWEGEGIG